jgi:nitrogen fixation protein FixH
MNVNSTQKQPPTTRRFEPWPTAIVIFFIVVFAANITMVLLGIDSWPGLVAENHYQKGLTYNQVINAQQAQDKLGWQIALRSDKLIVNQTGQLSVFLTDQDNQPIQSVRMEGILFRPVGEGVDIRFTFQEEEPGIYRSTIMPPRPGNWDVKLKIQSASQVDFRYVERIMVANQQHQGVH